MLRAQKQTQISMEQNNESVAKEATTYNGKDSLFNK